MPIAKIQLPDGRIARFEVQEGTTPQQVEAFAQQQFAQQDQQPTQEKSFLGKVGEAAMQIGPGLGELGVGAFQLGAELAGREDISRKLGERVAAERSQLTEAEKAGRVAGQIIGTAPLGAGMSLLKGAAASGAAISGLTPTKEGTFQKRAEQAAIGAVTGVATAGVLKGAGSSAKKAVQLLPQSVQRIKSGLGARTVEQLGETGIKLKEKSSAIYDAMRNIDASITKKAGTQLVTRLDEALKASGKLNPRLHGDTLSIVKDIRKAAKAGEIGLEELDQYRQLLSQATTKNTDRITGAVDPDGLKSSILIDKLDELVDGLKPGDLSAGGRDAVNLLNQARSDWKTFKKFEKITSLVEKAGGDPNRVKAIFQRFVANKKNLRGFTPEEKNALIFAAENTGGEKILKTLGKFGIDLGTSLTPGNTFLPAASVFAGALGGSAGGGVLTATAGTAARQLQKLVARGKVDEALRLIEKGGVGNVAEVISKVPNKKAQEQLLKKLLATTAAQQTTGE